MLLRSLLLLAALLLLVAGLASLVAPQDLTNPRSRQTTRSIPLTPPGPTAAAPPAVRWTLPGRHLVRALAGDVVEITINRPQRDVAEIEPLGVHWPVGDGQPATLRFVADQAGTFAVTLRYARLKLGVLEVAAPTG